MNFLERLRTNMLSVSCGFRVCVILFRKKRKILRLNSIDVVSVYKNRGRVNILFSPRAQPWLLWQVVLGRYGVMTSASYRFLSIPKGSFVFRFSPWMILSPSWEQSVDLMITDRRFRQCNKSLLKTEFLRFNLKQYWLGLWGNSSHEIASDIEVNMLFHQSLPSTKCLFHMSSEKDRVWFFVKFAK